MLCNTQGCKNFQYIKRILCFGVSSCLHSAKMAQPSWFYGFWWSAYSSSPLFFLLQYWCKLGSSVSSSIVRSSCKICCFLLVSIFKVKAMSRFGIGLRPKLKEWFRSLTILPTIELLYQFGSNMEKVITYLIPRQFYCSNASSRHSIHFSFTFRSTNPLLDLTGSHRSKYENLKIHSGTKILLYLRHFQLDTPTGCWEIFVLCKITLIYNMKRNAVGVYNLQLWP